MSARENQDKLRHQARMLAESKMPRVQKKNKVRIPEKTRAAKNQEHFDYLESL